MDTFLDDNYKEPNTSKYMKFEEGNNRFRVLPAKPGKKPVVMGWEYWKTVDGKRKPVRKYKDETISLADLEPEKDGTIKDPTFFWALAVWNYKAEAIQILEVKQKTVREGITALSNNSEWGSPTQYDLIVTQKIETGKVKYPSVISNPKKELPAEIMEKYDAMPLDLDALFSGKDPFATEQVAPEEVEVPEDAEPY